MAAATNPAVSIASACNCHPVGLIRAEKLPFAYISGPANINASCQIQTRSCHYMSCYLLSGDWRGGLRNKHQLFRALSLQAVTTENDPQGSDAPGPSSVQHVCTWQGGESAKPSLSEWLQSIQMMFNSAKKQTLSKSGKELQETKGGLLDLDVRHVVTQLRNSKLDSFAVQWWQNARPWIKWPMAIFVPWYLLVSIFYGISVSSDLLPLWILGPLGTASIIKTSFEVMTFCRWLVTYITSTQLAAGFIQLYEDARTGQLPQRIKGLSQFAAEKKSEIVLYVESGQLVEDLRQFLLRKLSETREWIVENYEDFRDWLRVSWLRLSRTLLKYF